MSQAARETADRIRIEDLRLRCVVGVHPDERQRPREVVLQITLHTDLRPAGASDALADTVDYQALHDGLVELVESSKDLLIERLAARVGERCLEDPRVGRVDVRLEKPGALPRARGVAVELTRVRDAGPGT